MSERPPLELAAEVTDAAGNVRQWDGNARHAGDIPSGITFNTKRGDGFSDGPQVTLQRRIDRDYRDIGLYDDFRLIAADGSVAYEGYIAADPRSFDGGHTTSVRIAGPMTRAQQRPFSEVYLDRDLSQWGSPSNAHQVALLAADFTPYGPSVQADPATGQSAVVTQWQSSDWTAVNRPDSEALYLAPDGVTLGSLYYEYGDQANVNPADANWTWGAYLADDDTIAVYDATGNLSPSVSGTGTLTATTATRTAAVLQLAYFGAFSTSGDTVGYSMNWRNLAVLGTHGLTLRSSDTPGPGGLYASDMIVDICRRFVPRLDPSGVQQTTYPVDHAVFQTVQPYDAWLQLNTFHLWELGVWENRRLCYFPADLSDYDWQVRLTDPGVTVDLPGDSVEQLANGIVVTYLDVQTARTRVLYPDANAGLQDPNPLNPATLHGETVWTSVDLSVIPLSNTDAVQIGAAKLAEYNQAKAAGTITITGHIRDRAGHWQPGWKVRASDTISIIDHPDSRPRLIGETSWDHDNLQCTIAVDNTLNRMDAYLDRATTALKAANVASG